MNDNKIYWLWLTLKDKLTYIEIKALINKFGDPLSIYNIEDQEELNGFSPKVKKYVMDKSLDRAISVYNKTKALNSRVVTIEDDEYPTMLKHIDTPPHVLYMYGERMNWEKLLTITVVGTRTYNKYGKNATQKISYDLAKAGAVVVSGMARGLDSVAAVAALKSGNKTVAVLGGGFDKVYPPEHKHLFHTIAKNGVVITEYPPDMKALPHNFPRRNRIMAGLSYGVLVTQAPRKSGALITASHAVEYGRDVYAVPGSMFSIGSQGCNDIIRQGAKLVTSYMDIMNEYPYFEIEIENEEEPVESSLDRVNKINFDAFNESQEKIIRLLLQGQCQFDVMIRKLGLEQSAVSTELLMLELNGMVKKLDGNMYELTI